MNPREAPLGFWVGFIPNSIVNFLTSEHCGARVRSDLACKPKNLSRYVTTPAKSETLPYELEILNLEGFGFGASVLCLVSGDPGSGDPESKKFVCSRKSRSASSST